VARSLAEIPCPRSVVERYQECLDIGVPVWQIPSRIGVTAQALERALHREGLPVPPMIRDQARTELKGNDK